MIMEGVSNKLCVVLLHGPALRRTIQSEAYHPPALLFADEKVGATRCAGMYAGIAHGLAVLPAMRWAQQLFVGCACLSALTIDP